MPQSCRCSSYHSIVFVINDRQQILWVQHLHRKIHIETELSSIEEETERKKNDDNQTGKSKRKLF